MASKPDVTLDDIAVELYALPPDEFIRARNARAKKLTDAALATHVLRLRKPLMAAWVVNLFARERADELGQALELARELREAQADLDVGALTALTRQRRALIRALTQEAAELAATRGERMTQATSDAVEQTLNAAMFHAEAAAAVASGRLVRPLEAAGIYPADLADAVAGEFDAAPVEAPRPVDEVKVRRARKEAERALRTAQNALAQAERDRGELDRLRKRANDQIDRLDERAADLEAELARVGEESSRAARERDALDDDLSEAGARVDEARAATASAQAALDDLRAE